MNGMVATPTDLNIDSIMPIRVGRKYIFRQENHRNTNTSQTRHARGFSRSKTGTINTAEMPSVML